jgi:hypothetical protein
MALKGRVQASRTYDDVIEVTTWARSLEPTSDVGLQVVGYVMIFLFCLHPLLKIPSLKKQVSSNELRRIDTQDRLINVILKNLEFEVDLLF